jgi:thiol-disulfide isomerase/thioredoxin
MDPTLNTNNDELRVNFNVTLERLPCAYVSMELHNSIGTHRTNITRNIIKYQVKTKGEVSHIVGVMDASEPRRITIQEVADTAPPEALNAKPVTLTPDNFESYVAKHDVVMVDFFAPWCVWCQRLHPVWENAAHEFAREFGPRKVGVAWVDCTMPQQDELCHTHHINAFPTIVSFRGGDSHSHEHYHGDRTVDAFKQHAKAELAKIDVPELDQGKRALRAAEDADFNDGDGKHAPAWEGCRLEGFALTPKVPGALVFQAVMHGHSINPARINVTHQTHHLSFGIPFTKTEMKVLPQEVAHAMHKLDGQEFVTASPNQTVEHYLNIVGTSFTYLRALPPPPG